MSSSFFARIHCASAASGLAQLFLLVSGTAMVVACGGDDEGDATEQNPPAGTPPPGGTNQAPSISGTPSTSVMQGTQYVFTPTASDVNGDVLTYSIVNKPSWATFNTATGRLQGTPAASDIRSYTGIRISVSDGRSTTDLGTFSIDVVATTSGAATLSWTPPTQNVDGSPLTDLAGYRVYWSTTSGTYPNSVTLLNPGLSSYMVEQLTPATWYFVATALDNSGNESMQSNVASKAIR